MEHSNILILCKYNIYIARKTISEPTTPSDNDMQRELKEVLTLFKEKKRNLDIVKTPDVYITQKSNPTEVQNWLKEKGFSEKTQKRLNGMTASELFKLNRDTLEEYCGVEDGKRLASQITVQRNISGVRTYFVFVLFNKI